MDIAEHLGPSAQKHAPADLWVTIPLLRTRAAQRYAMQHGDLIADHSRLADHDPSTMIDEHA